MKMTFTEYDGKNVDLVRCIRYFSEFYETSDWYLKPTTLMHWENIGETNLPTFPQVLHACNSMSSVSVFRPFLLLSHLPFLIRITIILLLNLTCQSHWYEYIGTFLTYSG